MRETETKQRHAWNTEERPRFRKIRNVSTSHEAPSREGRSWRGSCRRGFRETESPQSGSGGKDAAGGRERRGSGTTHGGTWRETHAHRAGLPRHRTPRRSRPSIPGPGPRGLADDPKRDGDEHRTRGPERRRRARAAPETWARTAVSQANPLEGSGRLPASRVGKQGHEEPKRQGRRPDGRAAPQDRASGFPAGNGSFAAVLHDKPWNSHPRGRRRRDLPEPIPEGTRLPGARQGESTRAGGPAEHRADAPGRATRGGRDARGEAWLQGAFLEDGPDRPQKPHRGSSTGRASRRPARTQARPTDAGEAGAVPGPGRETRGNRDRAARHTSRPRSRTTEQPPWQEREAPATPGTAPATSH